jgi:DNA-binding transcriptional LysR family regulator
MQALDPDFLRTFFSITETGTYEAAGLKVNKTQSSVSAQVKRLEEILGATLFEKSGRRNVLTASGRRLLEYAYAMVKLNEEIIGIFRPPEVSGHLKVGASDDHAQVFFPEVLASFARTHPAVRVEIITGTSSHLIPRMDQEDFDILVVARRAGDQEMEVLRQDRLHWIGAEGATAQFDETLPLALWPEGCSWREMALAALARHRRPWRHAYTTSNGPLLAATARSGLAVTIAPDWFVAPGLRILDELDERYPLGLVEMGIMTRPGRRTPAAEAFSAHLRTHFRTPHSKAA